MEELNEKDLLDTQITVLDFYAEWCGPCKTLLPKINELIDEYAEDKSIKILKINVDEQGAFASRFNVRSIPTVIFIKNGEVVNKFTGDRPKKEIINIIDEIKLSTN